MLRPGGYVAYVWKYPTPETPYTYLVDEIATRLTGRSLLAGAIYGIGTVSQLLRPGLEGYSRQTFEQPVAYTVERYVGYVSSRERIRQLLGARMDELLAELSERLGSSSRAARSSSRTSPTSSRRGARRADERPRGERALEDRLLDRRAATGSRPPRARAGRSLAQLLARARRSAPGPSDSASTSASITVSSSGAKTLRNRIVPASAECRPR